MVDRQCNVTATYRLFLDLDLFPHTTSQTSCYSWRRSTSLCSVQCVQCTLSLGLEKCFNPSQSLFWIKGKIIFLSNNFTKIIKLMSFIKKMLYRMVSIVLYVYSMNPSQYRAGKSFPKNRRLL